MITMAFEYLIGLIIGTILLFLFLYLAVKIKVSENKASSKKLMILLTAFLAVFLVPLIAGAIGQVLGLIGGAVAYLRSLIDGGGANMMGALVSIVIFLLFLILVHWLIDIDWGDSTWVVLIALFFLYLLYSFFPELMQFPTI
mgnify:CR=1 FL=1